MTGSVSNRSDIGLKLRAPPVPGSCSRPREGFAIFVMLYNMGFCHELTGRMMPEIECIHGISS